MSFYPAKGGGKKKYKKAIVKTTSTDGTLASVDVTIDGKTTRYFASKTSSATSVGDNFYIQYCSSWKFWSNDTNNFIYKDGDTISIGKTLTWMFTETKNYKIVKTDELADIFD